MPAMVSGGMPGPLSSTTMRVGFAALAGRDRDLDDRRDFGFLAGVDAVVDQLLDDDARPLVGLRGRSARPAPSRVQNSMSREVVNATRSILCAGSSGSFGRPDTMRRGFRPNRARATLMAPTLQPKAAAITGALSPRSHIFVQQLPALRRPADRAT